MSLKIATILLLLLSSSFCYAEDKSTKFYCGNNDFIVYFNPSKTKVAVIINDELAENTTIQQQPYGEDMNATLLGFDVWGENGGLHDHYTTVFSSDRKSIKQIVQLLDADNRLRGDAKIKVCHR